MTDGDLNAVNHYPRHVGDWLRDTAHLNEIEECVYSRMLDQYYVREHALPLDLAQVCRMIRVSSAAARKAVQQVLSEFFTLCDDGWHQKRCDKEIAAFQDRREKARLSGLASGAARSINGQRTLNERSTNVQRTFNSGGNERSTQRGTNVELAISSTRSKEAADAALKPSVKDPKTIIFSLGVQILKEHGGKEASSRSFLADQAKIGGHAKLAEVIGRLAADPKIEPRAYIVAAMKPPTMDEIMRKKLEQMP